MAKQTQRNEANTAKEKKVCRSATSLSVSATIMLGVALVLCLTVIAQVLSKGYVTFAGYSLFRVVTGSMEPSIPVGALLLSKEVEPEEIKTGDVICFRSREAGMLGKVVTHRVTAVLEGPDKSLMLETKGDANLTGDIHFVTQNNLIGRVVWHTQRGNVAAEILKLVTSRMGFLSCIVFPCLLLASLMLRDCIKNIRRELNNAERELAIRQKCMGFPAADSEEYKALCDRLRMELLEEMEKSALENQSGTQNRDSGNAECTEKYISASYTDASDDPFDGGASVCGHNSLV